MTFNQIFETYKKETKQEINFCNLNKILSSFKEKTYLIIDLIIKS